MEICSFRRNELYSRAEAGEGIGKEDIAAEITMTGTHGVAGGEVDWSTGLLVFWKDGCPTADGYFDSGLILCLRNDSLASFGDGFDVHHLLAVPVFD